MSGKLKEFFKSNVIDSLTHDLKKISINKTKIDNYTSEILKKQYYLHKNYVLSRKDILIKIRLPSIPEDISENIIKFIIHKNGDLTSTWNCVSGDLFSHLEGKQECKCFTSDGPLSFTPSSEWDSIYFLDARNWLNESESMILYKVSLKKSSEEWKNIKVNKNQTFDDQCKQGRRPRISWDSLYPQVSDYVEKIYSGTFEEIFLIE